MAIKVLRSDPVEEEEFLARFKREAEAMAALRHPNIIQVFDFDVQDETYYIVMELPQGDRLRTRLNYYRARGERVIQRFAQLVRRPGIAITVLVVVLGAIFG